MVYSVFVIFWPYKRTGICFSVQCRFILNKEKDDISIFLFLFFVMHGGRSMIYCAFVIFWPHKHNGIRFL